MFSWDGTGDTLDLNAVSATGVRERRSGGGVRVRRASVSRAIRPAPRRQVVTASSSAPAASASSAASSVPASARKAVPRPPKRVRVASKISEMISRSSRPQVVELRTRFGRNIRRLKAEIRSARARVDAASGSAKVEARDALRSIGWKLRRNQAAWRAANEAAKSQGG